MAPYLGTVPAISHLAPLAPASAAFVDKEPAAFLTATLANLPENLRREQCLRGLQNGPERAVQRHGIGFPSPGELLLRFDQLPVFAGDG
jgi:hypothetical protein